MIGRIHGVLLEKNPPQILVDVHGVGYEIDVPMSTFYNLPDVGREVTLLTHFIVREDAQLLLAAIDGAKGLYGAQDEELLGIVNEEAGRFFAGDCTAEQCAAVIQDRVSIYINERR